MGNYEYTLRSGDFYLYTKVLDMDFTSAVQFLYREVQTKLRVGGWGGSFLFLKDARTGEPLLKYLLRFDGGYYEYINPDYPAVAWPDEPRVNGKSPRPDSPTPPWSGAYTSC